MSLDVLKKTLQKFVGLGIEMVEDEGFGQCNVLSSYRHAGRDFLPHFLLVHLISPIATWPGSDWAKRSSIALFRHYSGRTVGSAGGRLAQPRDQTGDERGVHRSNRPLQSESGSHRQEPLSMIAQAPVQFRQPRPVLLADCTTRRQRSLAAESE